MTLKIVVHKQQCDTKYDHWYWQHQQLMKRSYTM